jgi:hypothetical protein
MSMGARPSVQSLAHAKWECKCRVVIVTKRGGGAARCPRPFRAERAFIACVRKSAFGKCSRGSSTRLYPLRARGKGNRCSHPSAFHKGGFPFGRLIEACPIEQYGEDAI